MWTIIILIWSEKRVTCFQHCSFYFEWQTIHRGYGKYYCELCFAVSFIPQTVTSLLVKCDSLSSCELWLSICFFTPEVRISCVLCEMTIDFLWNTISAPPPSPHTHTCTHTLLYLWRHFWPVYLKTGFWLLFPVVCLSPHSRSCPNMRLLLQVYKNLVTQDIFN